jgi:hypothetical protein
MKGWVLWDSRHLNEVWDGTVTKFVQRGHDINIVFNCTDLGEGQITLADDTCEQAISSRFLYYGRLEPTQVSVEGKLVRRAGILVFEGVWTDPIDGTGHWKFTIEIEDAAIEASPEVEPAAKNDVGSDAEKSGSVDAFPPDLLTPWYPVHVTPARPGIYQVRVASEALNRATTMIYANWDDKGWSILTPMAPRPLLGSGWESAPLFLPDSDWIRSWRGLTEAGYLSLQKAHD